MGESTTLTIRIDDDFKKKVDKYADANGLTTTDLVIQALKQFVNPNCPSCGRPLLGQALPGFSEQLQEVEAAHRRENMNQPYLILTSENGAAAVYWGAFDASNRGGISDGALPFRCYLDDYAQAEEKILIPRAVITGWRSTSAEPEMYQRMLVAGYVDGNERARNIYRARTGRGRKR